MFFKFDWAARGAALLVAAIACYALYIEYQITSVMLSSQGMAFNQILIRFFSYYADTTAILVGLVTIYVALRPLRALPHPRFLTSFVVYAVMSSLVRMWIERDAAQLQNFDLSSGRILDSVLPVAYFLFWLFFVQKGRVSFFDTIGWLAYPALFIMALVYQGSRSGFYPYEYLDAGALDRMQIFIHADIILACFIGVGLIIVAIDRLMVRWKGEVDE